MKNDTEHAIEILEMKITDLTLMLVATQLGVLIALAAALWALSK